MESISFDFAADVYDATRGFPQGVAEKVAGSLLSALEEAQDILEVGIGTGRISRPLIEESARRKAEATGKRRRLFGADLSPRMLSRLRLQLAPGSPQPFLVIGSALELPFPTGSFDAALMVHVIHLIQDWKAALNESRRVLKPSRTLIIGYESGEANDPLASLRKKLHDLALECCPDSPQFGPGSVEERTQWLLSTGAKMDVREAASWIESIGIGETIDTYAQGIHSATWRIPSEQRKEVVDRLRIWAREQFGSLDARFDVTRRFIWERFRWNADAATDDRAGRG